MRRRFVSVTIAVLLAPLAAQAKVDPQCSGVSATSAITGIVQNAKGVALQGLLVELYPAGQTGRDRATKDNAITDANGFYRICVGRQSGTYYDTFDVHVRAPDNAAAPLYATTSQPYSTYLNPNGDANFTPQSGYPLHYMTNLSITPNAISTKGTTAQPYWLVRSKAPANTIFDLTLEHPKGAVLPPRTVRMTYAGVEGGGPAAGGWNRWLYDEVIAANSPERRYTATVRGVDGTDGTTQVTQLDAQPYLIDNRPLFFGPKLAQDCSDGLPANGFQPAPPLGTTNRQPTVLHDVCDPDSALDGSRSGPDPYSLQGWLCPDAVTPVGSCTEINPLLNVRTITWIPSAPLANGSYYVRWRMADAAGNVSDSTPQLLKIGNTTGQVPFFTGLSPGNFGQGSTGGIILGSSLTTPSSLPVIGFRIVDYDGPMDVVPGSLQVRAYYGDERTLIYQYDPLMPKSSYDAVSRRGGADFDLSSGLFKATGYDLRGKPPGRYIVTASVTDYAGNNASVSWHFLLVAAL